MNKAWLALALCLLPLSPATATDIATQMNQAFNNMVNTTSPSTYQSAKRGHFSAGQIFIKNQQKNIQPFHLSLPRITAGCGGIDLYLGGFSYISADQFIQTFQAIGANALGYGVKLALQNACDVCENIMTSLEKTAQFINSVNIDSCRAAQGIVNAGVDLAQNKQIDMSAKSMLTSMGIVDDFTQSKTHEANTGNSAVQEVVSSGNSAEIQGNITWRAIKNSHFSNAFGGDNTFLELILSMAGTEIYSVSTDGAIKTETLAGAKITLKDFIFGGSNTETKIYRCDTYEADGCLMPTLEQNFNDEGMQKRVLDAYIGDEGFIQSQINTNEWSNKAKLVLSLPSMAATICNQKIYTLLNTDLDNTELAANIAEMCSTRVALEMSKVLIDSYFQEVETAILGANKDNAFSSSESKKNALATLSKARKRYDTEYQELIKTLPIDGMLLLLNNLNVSNGKIGHFLEH